MSQENMEGSPILETFRRAYLVSNEAFNRHDFEVAFSGLDADIEWHTVSDVPGPRILRGRRAVIEGFRELIAEFPDWRVEPQEFIEGGDTILVRNLATAKVQRAAYRYVSRSRKCGHSDKDGRPSFANISITRKPSKPPGWPGRRCRRRTSRWSGG